jgi:hypothetical protein
MSGSKKMKQSTAPTAMAMIDQTRRSRSSRRWSTTDMVAVGSTFSFFFFFFSFSTRLSEASLTTRAYRGSESAGSLGGGVSPACWMAPPGAGAAVSASPDVVAGPFCGVSTGA